MNRTYVIFVAYYYYYLTCVFFSDTKNIYRLIWSFDEDMVFFYVHNIFLNEDGYDIVNKMLNENEKG